MTGDETYRRLAGAGSHSPNLGGALITWVEPTEEHVHGYNRWYEDDHMVTGAMDMPFMFGARRWVAPKWIQHLRSPQNSRVAQPLDAGKYIGIYWISEGRLEDHEQWALGANYRLREAGRLSYRGKDANLLEERSHVFTSFSDHIGTTYRDNDVPLNVHTLMQPYQGMMVQVIDAKSSREELSDWLTQSYLPKVVTGKVALAIKFAPRALPQDKLAHVKQLDGVDKIVTVLHFLECDPRDAWDSNFASAESDIAAGGVATLGVQAAFIPTVQGTNKYVDELF